MIDKYEVYGKETGVGAFKDGCILGHKPAYTERSKTGNHWIHHYRNIPEKAIVVEWGNSRGGVPYWSVEYADGTPYEKDDARDIVLSVTENPFFTLE